MYLYTITYIGTFSFKYCGGLAIPFVLRYNNDYSKQTIILFFYTIKIMPNILNNFVVPTNTRTTLPPLSGARQGVFLRGADNNTLSEVIIPQVQSVPSQYKITVQNTNPTETVNAILFDESRRYRVEHPEEDQLQEEYIKWYLNAKPSTPALVDVLFYMTLFQQAKVWETTANISSCNNGDNNCLAFEQAEISPTLYSYNTDIIHGSPQTMNGKIQNDTSYRGPVSVVYYEQYLLNPTTALIIPLLPGVKISLSFGIEAVINAQ